MTDHPVDNVPYGMFPLVTPDDDGIRPAGHPDACIYCKSKVGHTHGLDCVTITKRVRVRYTFELEIDVPYSSTDEQVEFHRGESSWCAQNALVELDRAFPEDGPNCPCDGFSCKVLEVTDWTPTQRREK